MEFNFGRSIVNETHQSGGYSQTQFSGHTSNGSGQPSAAGNLGSYVHRIACSQESRPPVAISQSSTMSTSFMDESSFEMNRSQARFQEFIARNRHSEIMELLHDVKSRVLTLEEKMEAQQVRSMESTVAASKQGIKNTEMMLHGMSKLHEINAASFKAVGETLGDLRLELKALKKQISDNAHSHKAADPRSPLSRDEVSLLEYFVNKRPAKNNSKSDVPNFAVKDYPDFNPLTCTQNEGYYGPEERKEEEEIEEDSFEIDSFMTDPIMY